MALSRVHTWSAGEVLLASDLNAEFNNVLTNALTLISPLTAALNAGGFVISNIGQLQVGPASSAIADVYDTLGTISGGQSISFTSAPTWASASLSSAGFGYTFSPTATGNSTVPAITAFQAGSGTWNSSTITAYTGFNQLALNAGTFTSAYAYRGQLVAASGKYNLYMDGTAQNYLAGPLGAGVVPASTSNLTVAASTTGVSSLNIPHGAAPSSPVNGDVWSTTAGLFIRINGVTKTVTLT